MKKIKKSISIPIIICIIMIALNIVSRLSKGFADFYLEYIFPVISTPMAFISNLFSFSLGEILIIIVALFIAIGLVISILSLIIKKERLRKINRVFPICLLWVITYILTTETLNAFIMYQCTPFSEKYFNSTSQHTDQELTMLYEILINESNKLAPQVKRDDDGYFMLTVDCNSTAKEAMKNISDDYPILKGYYPDAKPIINSFIMSQTGTLGVYMPFTVEANYNTAVYDSNLPNTFCHELAHLKGIISEDEAGFIAFIASTKSESIEFQYSGYLNALEYVHNEIYKNNITSAQYLSSSISEYTSKDWFTFVPETYWEQNKKKEIISSETVDIISDKFTDTSLKINGVEDGIKSYSRMVTLLLDYYFPQ